MAKNKGALTRFVVTIVGVVTGTAGLGHLARTGTIPPVEAIISSPAAVPPDDLGRRNATSARQPSSPPFTPSDTQEAQTALGYWGPDEDEAEEHDDGQERDDWDDHDNWKEREEEEEQRQRFIQRPSSSRVSEGLRQPWTSPPTRQGRIGSYLAPAPDTAQRAVPQLPPLRSRRS